MDGPLSIYDIPRAEIQMLQRPRSRDVLALGLVPVVPAKKTFNASPFPPKASLMRHHSVHNVTSTLNGRIHVSICDGISSLRGHLTTR